MLNILASGVVRKYATKALYLVAPKVLEYGWNKFQAWNTLRKLKKANREKGEAYVNAPSDSAHDSFRDLP